MAQQLNQTESIVSAAVIGFSALTGGHNGVIMVTSDYASTGTDLMIILVHAMSLFILISQTWASKIMETEFLRNNLLESSLLNHLFLLIHTLNH